MTHLIFKIIFCELKRIEKCIGGSKTDTIWGFLSFHPMDNSGQDIIALWKQDLRLLRNKQLEYDIESESI